MRKRVVIVGLGLIGGSLALALKDFEDCELIGVDVSQPTLRYASEHGVAHRLTSRAADVVGEADVSCWPCTPRVLWIFWRNTGTGLSPEPWLPMCAASKPPSWRRQRSCRRR